jgi:orotidine-5'-phosphate decarboxylase
VGRGAAPITRNSGLVVAIDLEDLDRALAVAAAAGPHVDAVKVGYPTVLSCGTAAVAALAKASGRPVICDFKIADIPPVAGAIAARAVASGARGVICHAFAGADTVAAVVRACDGAGALPIAVVEMSHPGGATFTQPAAERLVDAALEGGARAIVAPATRPGAIAALKARARLPVFSPGAGAQGGSAEEAARAGADFVIVGRTISTAADPAAAAKAAAASIAKGVPRARA